VNGYLLLAVISLLKGIVHTKVPTTFITKTILHNFSFYYKVDPLQHFSMNQFCHYLFTLMFTVKN